jgi:hypothetical protein
MKTGDLIKFTPHWGGQRVGTVEEVPTAAGPGKPGSIVVVRDQGGRLHSFDAWFVEWEIVGNAGDQRKEAQ